MNLETVFYTLGIAAIIVNFIVLFFLGVLGYRLWQRYKQFQQSAVFGLLAAGMATLPRMAIIPVVRKVWKHLMQRNK